MAQILIGKTKCALCNVVIKDNDEVVATSHFIADSEDPLWRFSDAAMHKKCFLEWDQRGPFVEKFNRIAGAITHGNGTYHQMNSDGSIASLSRENRKPS
jgi:hypothetical protein